MHGANLARIRQTVRALGAEFAGTSWRDLERERVFPQQLMAAAIAE
jgi:hypothetical protein